MVFLGHPDSILAINYRALQVYERVCAWYLSLICSTFINTIAPLREVNLSTIRPFN